MYTNFRYFYTSFSDILIIFMSIYSSPSVYKFLLDFRFRFGFNPESDIFILYLGGFKRWKSSPWFMGQVVSKMYPICISTM